MLRYTFERLDEQGRVIETKHDYQPDGTDSKALCSWIRETFGWGLDWEIEHAEMSEENIHVYMEQLDDKGHRIATVQVF